MPLVHSDTSKKGDSTENTSTDWSMNTPASTDTTTSTSTGASGSTAANSSALGTAASTSVRSTRSTRAAAAATQQPTRTESAPAPRPARIESAPAPRPARIESAPAPHPARADRVPHDMLPPSNASTETVRAQPNAHTAFVENIVSSCLPRTTYKPKNIGGQPAVPPFASSDMPAPRPKHSARSTKSTRRMELEARLELQRKQLQAAQNAVALAETELELTQCQSEEEFDDELEMERSTHIEQWVNHTTTYLEQPKEPERSEPTKKSELTELASAIVEAARMVRPQQAPPRMWDLPEFSGSHEDWLPFKKAFEESKELCTDIHNMARLRQSIKGTAKEAVRSLLFATSDPEKVMASLERNFGRPNQLALAELQKIKNLPRLGDTPREICIFASRINNAVTTINALNKPHYMHLLEVSQNIVDKFSPILRYRWSDYNARIGEQEPELIKLKNFLNNEAELCGNLTPLETTKKRTGERRYPVNTVHEDETKEPETVAATQEAYKKFCFQCEGEHWLTECPNFKKATVEERWETAKKKRLCFRCLRRRHMRTNCRGPSCKKCKRPHHVMLHSEPTNRAIEPPQQQEKPSTDSEDAQNVVKSVYATADGTKVYLKMIPVDIYGSKGSARILALLDEGSTVSLLDSDVAARVGATGVEDPLMIETVGGKIIEMKDSQKMNLKIKGAHRRDKKVIKGVRTVENLKLSPQFVNKRAIEECSHLKNMLNELLYEKERPALLIGQDNWDLIVSRKILKGKYNEPAASLTSLGWVLHGCCTGAAAAPVNYVNHCRSIDKEEDEMEKLIKEHFDLDSIGIRQRRPSNDADQRALTVLEKTTKQLEDGRYESGLLWKTEDETLPNNYAQAFNRLLGIEKKLDKNATLEQEYEKQLGNLLSNGYAEEAPSNTRPGRTFYLPHFAVVHPQKKKMRIVFDAAARFEGKSLNDALLPGPDLLQSLFGVLLRFREGPVAVVADIKEMFLRIRIREEDRDSLRFLWRGKERKSKPTEYRMTSVIFGAASSPATAIYVKNLNAQKHEKEHPEAVRAIIRNHYMDDYLQSFTSIDEAKRVAEEVDRIHRAAGFELRQWTSNDERTLLNLKNEEIPTEKKIGNEEKTLGMIWHTKEDALAFNVGLRNVPPEVADGNRAPTKREVTSAVMSTFDPMGLVAPALIKGKKLIQDLWRTGVKWDEAINDEQREVWDRYLDDVKTLRDLKIPRCLAPTSKAGEMHTFVDASETAYAAAVYWRTTANDGDVSIFLMAGKARVTPTKTTSIPRLELQAALLGARIAATIEHESNLEITARVFWSDSTTVLQWIKADPRRFKPFVAHRLAELEDITKPREWRWVPTKDNPADDATRNMPQNFNEQARWFNGPAFLYRPKSEWPLRRIEREDIDLEEKKATCATASVRKEEAKTPDLNRFSTWLKLLRTTARVFMFVDRCRQKKSGNKNAEKQTEKSTYLPIESQHLMKAEKALIRQSQRETFPRELKSLKCQSRVETPSRLKNIDVTLDDEGVLRLNSRTMKIQDDDRNQRLPILDGKHRMSQLLIEHCHRRLHHGSHATVTNELRQRYWILGLRNIVRQIAHRCQWCIVKRRKPEMPPLGDLPRERLAYNQPPFTCTGVDFFGPMHVTIGRRREKRWGALFTCLTTRAVHLELAASLNVSSMIMALRRMAARRGTPRTIFSDNGTNFVGTDHELKQEAKKIQGEELVKAAENEGICWKFIPPGAPNMGGAWERLVRTVKTALVAVLGEKSPPEEVLHTLLTEVEHTVNSRPLTHLSADPNDEEGLTPNHFLIGRSCGTAVMAQYDDLDLIGKPNWKTAQRMADHFWNRWLREYLPTLAPRKLDGKKNPEFRRGDVVIIADSSLPRNTWPRGIIEDTFPGPDGRIRIVNVKTRGGLMRRPTSRLILVTAATRPENGVPEASCTGGENVSYVAS